MFIFEQASRERIRFQTQVGAVSVEDLWDLPLSSKTNKPNLDDIAKGLYKELKNTEDAVSFVNKPATSSKTNRTQLMFDIVMHIINVRLEENAVAAKTRETAEKRQKIMEILADREENTLKTASTEDLNKMLDELKTA